MQFPFLPVGVKWKVVKNVHFPLLLIDTGLMYIGPLTKKLLQKHRPVSYRKGKNNNKTKWLLTEYCWNEVYAYMNPVS